MRPATPGKHDPAILGCAVAVIMATFLAYFALSLAGLWPWK